MVLLLADGGWKYLSTNLWAEDYTNLHDDIDAKVWW
jgi:cysteine synthase B